MKRLGLILFWLCMTMVHTARADGEIGYVEDFNGLPGNYIVTRGTDTIPLKLLMPVYAGDMIEALTEKGRLSLRLVDHPELIVWSRADKGRPISAEVTDSNYWSSVLSNTLAAISPYDQQKRERVLTAIRGDEGDFAVPLLQTHQTLAAGKRKIALGWLKSSAVTAISITAKNGQKLVTKSKGVGGLWTSPSINLKPGAYSITVTSGTDKATGQIDVIAAADMPKLPAELTNDNIPEALRHTAQAAWLAAQNGGQFHIEALQIIASDRSRPATVLTDALIAGKTIDLPK